MIEVKHVNNPSELWQIALDLDAEVVKFHAYNETFFYDVTEKSLENMNEIWRRAIYNFAVYGTASSESISKMYLMDVTVLKNGMALAECRVSMIRLVPSSESDLEEEGDDMKNLGTPISPPLK